MRNWTRRPGFDRYAAKRRDYEQYTCKARYRRIRYTHACAYIHVLRARINLRTRAAPPRIFIDSFRMYRQPPASAPFVHSQLIWHGLRSVLIVTDLDSLYARNACARVYQGQCLEAHFPRLSPIVSTWPAASGTQAPCNTRGPLTGTAWPRSCPRFAWVRAFE